ncbi:exodeoxyribonuclease VII large subunit [Rhodobacterales bacterium HKCCE2091]|nr:exodeoxyribonuclease VII large subunit [Rhodobacterales bacterium HKCCE2091]
MSDLIDDDGPGAAQSNAPEFSVSELTGSIKRTLESAFGRVRVRGELGRVMKAKSGHYYYDLKDDRNVINCTTWKGQVAGLGIEPEEGMEVIVTGRLSAYGPQSRYNLNVDSMEIAGAGALMAMLEKRRKALAAEGLFDEARKRPLPYLPEVIGVVTSPTGAVIRDILHRLRDRFPRKVLIWPVAVQGQNSAAEVARGIRGFNALTPGGAIPRPDLLIVARGGGSLEDLWGFNEEIVVRAAADSVIPLISAVGHETDTTLIDFAADRRAPTPTAAAEMAVPVRLDLLNWTEAQGGRLTRAATAALQARRQRLGDLSRGLPRAETLFEGPRQTLDRWSERLGPALSGLVGRHRQRLDRVEAALTPALERGVARRRVSLGQAAGRLSFGRIADRAERGRRDLSVQLRSLDRALAAAAETRRARLDALSRLLQSLGYTETLKRGYAVVREGEEIVTGAGRAAGAASLEIEFQDGRVTAVPAGGASPGGAGGGGAKRPVKFPPRSQGDLFGD